MNRTPLTLLARRLRVAAPSQASDRQQLLARFRDERDEDAFTELVRRNERAVLAACRQVLTDPADVEDAFQATFLALVQQAKRVTCGASLGGWLFAVAHRVALRAARSRARNNQRETAAARPVATTPEPGTDLSWREAVTALHEALDALPDRFRLPLILCYLDGLSRDEAAAQLGWKAGAVKAGLERGREKLRTLLARRGILLGAGLFTTLAGSGSPASASPELVAATLRTVGGAAPAPLLQLARPTMTTLTTRTKLLLLPAVLVALCAGLLAAGMNPPPAAGAKAPPPDPQPKAPNPTTPNRGRSTVG